MRDSSVVGLISSCSAAPLGAANTPVASLERPNNMGTLGFVKRPVGWFDGV